MAGVAVFPAASASRSPRCERARSGRSSTGVRPVVWARLEILLRSRVRRFVRLLVRTPGNDRGRTLAFVLHVPRAEFALDNRENNLRGFRTSIRDRWPRNGRPTRWAG